MSNASPSARMLLPFGSLMGSLPIDSLLPGQVPGDANSLVAEPRSEFLSDVALRGYRITACAALPPSLTPRRDGGI